MNKNKLPNHSLSAHIEYSSGEKISDLITKFKIRIMYEGANRNGSFFSRETMDKLGDTIGGIPVVGHYSKEEKDFLGHGDLVISMVNGVTEMRKEGPTPYGFVPHNAKVWYEPHLDKDGVQRTYMTTDVYLWTGRYEELEVLKYGQNNQSMELNPSTMRGYWDELDGEDLYVIDYAEFNALCILGQAVEPAFEGSQVEYSEYDYSKPFADKLKDMKNELHAAFSLQEDTSEVDEMHKDKEKDLEQDKALNEDTEVEKEELEEIEEAEFDADEAEEKAEEALDEEVDEVEEDESDEDLDKDLEDLEEEEEDLDDVEPSEEDLKDIEEDCEDPVSDDELEELINMGSDIDDMEALEADYNKLKEDYEQVLAELEEYKLKELREEKKEILGKYQSDIQEEDYNKLLADIDNYSVEDLETKAQAVAYATLKNIIDVKRTSTDDKADFSLKSSVSLRMEDEKTSTEQSKVPRWMQIVLDKQ